MPATIASRNPPQGVAGYDRGRSMPPKPFDLAPRHALVTGCGSAHGIGFASARMLARLGARISITSTTERIHERESELGDETSSLSDRRFGSCRRSLWLPKIAANRRGLPIRCVGDSGLSGYVCDHSCPPF